MSNKKAEKIKICECSFCKSEAVWHCYDGSDRCELHWKKWNYPLTWWFR